MAREVRLNKRSIDTTLDGIGNDLHSLSNSPFAMPKYSTNAINDTPSTT